MKRRVAEIRAALRIAANTLPQLFESAAADVLQIHTIWTARTAASWTWDGKPANVITER